MLVFEHNGISNLWQKTHCVVAFHHGEEPEAETHYFCLWPKCTLRLLFFFFHIKYDWTCRQGDKKLLLVRSSAEGGRRAKKKPQIPSYANPLLDGSSMKAVWIIWERSLIGIQLEIAAYAVALSRSCRRAPLKNLIYH